MAAIWRLAMTFVVGLAWGSCVLATAADADEQGFVSIFDGSLDGWEGKTEFWSVADGAIVGQTTAENPTQGNTFLFWRQGELDDFELRLSYRITGGNSGIQYRSRDLGNAVVGGYQADIAETKLPYCGILYEEKGRGILAKRGQRITVTPNGEKQAREPIGTPEDLGKAIKCLSLMSTGFECRW